MPTTHSLEKSSNGKPYMRSVAEGQVTAEDARELVTMLQEGGPYFRMAMLAVVKEGTNYAPEARKAFTEIGDTVPASAIVVTSAVLRVTLNFVIKAGMMRNGTAGNVRFFSSESEALGWLETQLA